MVINKLQNIVIVGGGTAGWMTASALSRFLQGQEVSVRLIESEDLGVVGVGEATVPLIQDFNGMLGIDEVEFIKKTRGSFKLGIDFKNWGKLNNRFFHPFGDFGETLEGLAPHHHWLKLKMMGDKTPIGDYSFSTVAAYDNRFAPPPSDKRLAVASYKYAYHFDATLYAKLLREYSEAAGVQRIESKILSAKLRKSDGFIESIVLDSGEEISGDLFIDCSGFTGLLIEKALKTGYVDWSHWLPCNRAIAAPCELKSDFSPYTRSTAREAGWQWRIPLQHRVGNGYVYSNNFIEDAAVESIFLQSLEGALLAEPKLLKFVAGHRKKSWNKNCVAIGLAAGFLEPLESSGIQLIQTAVTRLISFFPDKSFDPVIIDEFNRITQNEYDGIRDFLIAHYCLGERDDAELWKYCRTMELPDSLKHRLELFRSCGNISLVAEDSYREPSWVSILVGLNLMPKRYDPFVDRISDDVLVAVMKRRREEIKKIVSTMPTHHRYVAEVCPAKLF